MEKRRKKIYDTLHHTYTNDEIQSMVEKNAGFLIVQYDAYRVLNSKKQSSYHKQRKCSQGSGSEV